MSPPSGAGRRGGRPGRRGGRPLLVAGVAALVAVLVAGVAGARWVLVTDEPLPLPPGPGVLDDGGLGSVRLGMDTAELSEAACDVSSCSRGQLIATLTSTGRACYQVTWGVGVRPGHPGSGWAWLRDGTTVAVGVTADAVPAGRTVTVAPGVLLGDALDPLPRPLRVGWARDPDAAVTVLRRSRAGVTRVLADTTGDGRVDYAVVMTAQGERCHAPLPDVLTDIPRPPQQAVIDAGRLRGVSLGMPVADVLAVTGWTQAPPDGATCGQLWWDGRFETGGYDYAVAYATDTVVGLSAAGVAGGPVAGTTLDEAIAVLGPSAGPVRAQAGTTPYGPGPVAVTRQRVTGRTPEGLPVSVVAIGFPGHVEGIDRPVSAAAAGAVSIVTGVVVGRSCQEAP